MLTEPAVHRFHRESAAWQAMHAASGLAFEFIAQAKRHSAADKNQKRRQSLRFNPLIS
jgi:hypothetical protein